MIDILAAGRLVGAPAGWLIAGAGLHAVLRPSAPKRDDLASLGGGMHRDSMTGPLSLRRATSQPISYIYVYNTPEAVMAHFGYITVIIQQIQKQALDFRERNSPKGCSADT